MQIFEGILWLSMLSQSCCFVNISSLMVVMIFGHREANECETWRSSWSQIGNFCCPGLLRCRSQWQVCYNRYICVEVQIYMCWGTDIYVLRYRYICVEVQIYMCWGTDIYVLRYRYICVAPPLCIIFLSSLTKQKKKSWQFRTSLLIWLIIYCIFHT